MFNNNISVKAHSFLMISCILIFITCVSVFFNIKFEFPPNLERDGKEQPTAADEEMDPLYCLKADGSLRCRLDR